MNQISRNSNIKMSREFKVQLCFSMVYTGLKLGNSGLNSGNVDKNTVYILLKRI